MTHSPHAKEVAHDDQSLSPTLEQLYAFRDHLDRLIINRGVRDPRSESERHLMTHGHRLAYGCCREL